MGTFTLIHTRAGFIVRSIVLKTAPLGDTVKIILGVTKQSIIYTAAPRGIVLQHSGGLANSNFFSFQQIEHFSPP